MGLGSGLGFCPCNEPFFAAFLLLTLCIGTRARLPGRSVLLHTGRLRAAVVRAQRCGRGKQAEYLRSFRKLRYTHMCGEVLASSVYSVEQHAGWRLLAGYCYSRSHNLTPPYTPLHPLTSPYNPLVMHPLTPRHVCHPHHPGGHLVPLRMAGLGEADPRCGARRPPPARH